MKHPKLIIQIPEPCHENWHQMSPTEKGRFCQACTKEVVDFTAKSDEEVIRYFSNNGNVCGRFDASQLNRKLIVDRKKRNHWLSYVASLLFPLSLLSQEKSSKVEKLEKTEQTDSLSYTKLNVGSLQRKAKPTPQIQNDSITVKGIVRDDKGQALPGAIVLIKGSKKLAMTSFDGDFTINANVGDELIVSYTGHDEKRVKITKNQTHYDFVLNLTENSKEQAIICAPVYQLRGVAGMVTVYEEDRIQKRIERKEKREKRRAERAKRKEVRKAKKQDNLD